MVVSGKSQDLKRVRDIVGEFGVAFSIDSVKCWRCGNCMFILACGKHGSRVEKFL